MKKTITMMQNQKKSAGTPGSLKNLFIALIILSLSAGLQTIQAQTRIVVEPDNFPMSIGALNIAIEQNGGDVIYVLKNGKTYFLDRAMEFNHFLQIEAEEYPSNNPPIIRPGANLMGTAPNISNFRNNILMKGIFFYAISDLGVKQQSQRATLANGHLHYQHCYFMGATNYFWQFYGNYNTVRIEDSQIANSGRHTSVANQRFIDLRSTPLDSIIVINSSIYNINFHIIRTGGNRLNYLYMDHFTAINHSLSMFDLAITKDVTIKNSLFHQTNLDGAWESAELVGEVGPGYVGPRYYTRGGMINITSIDALYETNPENAPYTDADRSIVIKNNNFGGLPSQEYLDLWEEFNIYDPVNKPILSGGRGSYPWGTDPAWRWANPDITPDNPAWALRDTIQLARIQIAPMDSMLTAWATQKLPNVIVENNIREAVTVPDMPQMPVEFVRAIWYGTQVMPHYDRWNDIVANESTRFFHPGPGTPVATTGPTAAWFRNLAYNEDSQSFTNAERGYPVGNLNFYPELKEQWLQGISVSVDEIPTSTITQIRAYPNPAKDILYLSQEVDEVTIYSLLGQQVFKSTKVQTVNVSGLHNGVYILRIVNDNQVNSQKIVVSR